MNLQEIFEGAFDIREVEKMNFDVLTRYLSYKLLMRFRNDIFNMDKPLSDSDLLELQQMFVLIEKMSDEYKKLENIVKK